MLTSKTFYYAKDNSTSQNLKRQLEAFKTDGADERDIITEMKSGKVMDKEAYHVLRTHLLREGDTLVVMSLDMLGKNKKQIRDELKYYGEHNIRVRILDIPTTSYAPSEGQEWVINIINNILIEVLSSQAEHEQNSIRKRQAEGIAIAKAKGKYRGGQQKQVNEDMYQFLYAKYMRREISKKDMAAKLGVSRPTLDRIIKRHIE